MKYGESDDSLPTYPTTKTEGVESEFSIKSIIDYIKETGLVYSESLTTIANDTAMAEMGYPQPTPNQMYMVYDVSIDAVEPELYGRPWTIEPFVKDKDGAPIIVTYTNLFPEAFNG